MSLNKNQRAEARLKLKDSYIKRLLRQKGLMAKDFTWEIIEKKRQSIISLRKKKKLSKKLLTDGKYKCSRCFVVKPLGMFYKDSSKKHGYQRSCKECASVSETRGKATKKYLKRITENLEDVYIKKILYKEGIKLEDVTSKMIIRKRESIQEYRDRADFKNTLLKENKRICRVCNKPKKNKTFIKKSHLTNVCLDCYNLMVKASKENTKIWEREYYSKNADRLRKKRKLYILNNPQIIKRGRQREKIKRREKSLNSMNTCNDCNIELGFKKDTKGIVVCNPCELIRKEIIAKKTKERYSNLTEEQKIQIRKKANKKMKKIRDNLGDIYIKNQLCSGGILKTKDIPQEMVEAKRQHLKLTRTIREES